jgi:hypothetical protein
MRLNFIHECIQNKTISLKYINTNLEVADVLTKLLPVSAHELHTQRLMKGHYAELPQSTDLNRRTMVKTELLKKVLKGRLSRQSIKLRFKRSAQIHANLATR